MQTEKESREAESRQVTGCSGKDNLGAYTWAILDNIDNDIATKEIWKLYMCQQNAPW